MEQLPLINSDDGQALEGGNYGFEFHGLKDGAFREGLLEWVAQDGSFRTTDPKTGETTIKFQLEPAGYDPATMERAHSFSEDRLAVLTASMSEESPASYVEYDRVTGDKLTELEIPEIGTLVWNHEHFRDLAIRPEPRNSTDG